MVVLFNSNKWWHLCVFLNNNVVHGMYLETRIPGIGHTSMYWAGFGDQTGNGSSIVIWPLV